MRGRVVHLTSRHRRYDSRVLSKECFSLRNHGYDVTLVVNDDQDDEILENGIKIVSTGFVPERRWNVITKGVLAVYKLGIKQNAEIYHLHDAELLLIALKLKAQGKKVIFDSHEFYGEVIKARKWIPFFMRGSLSLLYNYFETYICRRIDGVVSVGKYNGKDWFENRSKCYVYVGNYPKLEYINIPDYYERQGLCYCGGIWETRGITNVVKACIQANARIALVGEFSSEAYKNKIVNDIGGGSVHWLGYISSRNELLKICSQFAIGIAIMPNKGQFEKLATLLTKVYDYMFLEMPVILSDFPYNRELINKYHFGLIVNPEDIDDIAIKIKWLLDHPREAKELGKNGKKLLMEQFIWEYAAEPELLQLYSEVGQN